MGYTTAMPTFTAEQVTAAGAYLGWSQQELGDASGLSFEKIRDYEHDGPSAQKASKQFARQFTMLALTLCAMISGLE
jgi:hypothetical protein